MDALHIPSWRRTAIVGSQGASARVFLQATPRLSRMRYRIFEV